MITTPAPSTPGTTPDKDALARAAYESTAAVRAALSVENLPPYNLSAPYAVGKALHASAWCLPFRPRLLQLRSEFDVAYLDHLQTYALGLLCVHTETRRRVLVLGQVPELAKEGFALRAQLMGYAELLCTKERIEAELIARLKEGAGYRDLAEDLNVLVGELRAQEVGVVTDVTPVTPADLGRAAEIAYEILLRVGNPAQIDTTQDALLQERRKLGALLVEAQDQVRRGMTFLRWKEKDIDTYVPSLYVPGGGRPADDDAVDPLDGQDLVALHERLHAQPPPTLHPDDNPFVTEE